MAERPELSRYVVETWQDGEPVLFETVQKESLPIDASREQLRKRQFLAGQEEESINSYLFERAPKYLVLNISPTWLCNLRCGHCVVINRLVKQEPKGLDVDLVVDFICAHIEKYNTPKVKLRFAGGEPLLVAGKICELCEKLELLRDKVLIDTNMTTNLAMDIGEIELRAISYMDEFGASLDGLEGMHNKQRKSCDGSDNPFEKTVSNLKKLILLGMREKMHVQGAIREENFHEKKDYFRLLMKIGILPAKIKFGCLHPTDKKPLAAQFNKIFHDNHFYSKPCCKYQFMSNFCVDPTDSLFSDYYSFVRVGSLTDPIDQIAEAARTIIREQISILNDPGCLKCPVVGYCWGGCTAGEFFWKGNPSQYCDQERLKGKVNELAGNGRLIDTYG
jgi:radical SAM protein with 4Fe4S-binding SPASM domain